MSTLRAVVLSVILTSSWCFKDLSFPPGFKFGIASSAYQIEGGWNASDKGVSIWDHFTHNHPEKISDHSTGNVACDSYHLWKRDIQMVHELGVHFYRFSISWPRLMPTGFHNHISKTGKQYYNNLIDGLLEKGIKPLITIYHWDLPQRIQELGGWTNPLISDWFADYARVVFSLFGDRVKTWITINEPLIMCEMSYNDGTMAPGIVSPELGTYLCNKHTLMAHAKAWRMYDKEFRHKFHGEVSLVNHMFWYEPYAQEDEELTELAQENSAGRYSHPIFSKEGGWPPSIVEAMALNSRRKGFLKSNFPPLTQDEIELMRGTYDFYAMNHYSSRQVRRRKPGEKLGSWPIFDGPDLDIKLSLAPEWKAASWWFAVNPPGIRKQLVWLKKHYGDMKFIIAENGYPTNSKELHDPERMAYLHDNLEQVLLAIREDGINIAAYTAWSLMDSFEWMDGYKSTFGLFQVDFKSPEKTRTPRASAHYYRRIIKAHSLDVPKPHMFSCDGNMTIGTTPESIIRVLVYQGNFKVRRLNMVAVAKMCSRKAVVFSALLTAVWCVEDLVFPTGFMFGSATSAYQVEGAWNISDKSESIWDRVLHSRTWSTDSTNGDVACDSYHQWRRDVEMAVELGLHFYRFSISWPRLLPTGFANQISEDGKNYYNNLIDALLERGIQPLVTIFHWDLPQSLQDLGGWTNPLIVEWFEDYARVVYSLYADRVHWWITINEPTSICDSAYSVALFAPGIIDPDVSLHLCSKHVLLAHAKAWRVYDMEYKSLYHGKVSICNNLIWYEPKTQSDVDAAELSVQYVVGKYTHPIYSKEGGWPPAIEESVNAYGARLGFRQPRLPPFTEEERELVKGTYDYYAFNHYCSLLARHATPGEDVSPHYLDGIVELDIVIEVNPDWPSTFSPIFYIHPEGLRRQIAWMREKYGDMEFIIIENGFTTSGAMNDFDRMDYIYSYLEQVWLSIFEDGANITGYSYWSLMDSFEWNDTRLKFGLYHVDFNSTERTRSPRASADYYKSIIRNKAVHNPRPKT